MTKNDVKTYDIIVTIFYNGINKESLTLHVAYVMKMVDIYDKLYTFVCRPLNIDRYVPLLPKVF